MNSTMTRATPTARPSVPPLTLPKLRRHHRAWWCYALLIAGSYLVVRIACG